MAAPEPAAALARSVERLARAALLEEVRLTPKPGLVDRGGPGAHADMDYPVFRRAIQAIGPYFGRAAAAALAAGRRGCPAAGLLDVLRPIGLEAERAMFAATGGVNTHKGSIFSVGLLCGAAGWLAAKGRAHPGAGELCRVAARAAAGLVRGELEPRRTAPRTTGERLYARYGVTGARGQAAGGFAVVRRLALPVLRLLGRLMPSRRAAHLQTVLLGLMAVLADTNILGRGGQAGLRRVRRLAAGTLLLGSAYTRLGRRAILRLDRRLSAERLSPGGAADLLAVTIFLDSFTAKPT